MRVRSVAIAAFIADLEGVISGGEGRAIGHIGKGTANRCSGGVADYGKHGAQRKSSIALRAQYKPCSVFDTDSVGAYLVGFGMRSKT